MCCKIKAHLKLIPKVIFGLVFSLSSSLALAANYSPKVGTISPASGSSGYGQPVMFTTTYTDANGWQNIQYVHLLINTSTKGTNCFYGYYNQNTNKLYLRNNANTSWLGGFSPASSNIIENSYAQLNCAQTTISGSGTTLTVKWAVTFKSTFLGAKNTYLYVKDDTNRVQSWTKKGTWTITKPTDTIPPTGSININNDAQYTNSLSVTLYLLAQDNSGGSGLSQMQFSNNNSTWSTPEAYATTKAWSLSSGDGQKTVYVKYKDVAGNWSTSYSDTIILDTIKPAITITTPQDGAVIIDP